MGARVKHFSYFEKGDVPYYEVPSAYTELFLKVHLNKVNFWILHLQLTPHRILI